MTRPHLNMQEHKTPGVPVAAGGICSMTLQCVCCQCQPPRDTGIHRAAFLPGEHYGSTLHTLLGYTDVDESWNACLPPGYPCLFAQHCSCHEPPTSERYADALLHITFICFSPKLSKEFFNRLGWFRNSTSREHGERHFLTVKSDQEASSSLLASSLCPTARKKRA
jgi:hypothetical protein